MPNTKTPETTYRNAEGHIVSLHTLCKPEPEWAANTIRRLRSERDELKEAAS